MSAYDVLVDSSGLVYTAASKGAVIRHGLDRAETLRSGEPVQSLWLAPSGALHFVGDAHYVWADGEITKTKIAGLDDLMCVWGSADDDVWVGGSGAELAHFDGNDWSHVDTGLANRSSDYIGGITGIGGEVIACGEKGAAWFDGATWRVVELDLKHGCLNDAVTLSDGTIAMCGQDADGPLVLLGSGGHGFERISVELENDDEELYRLAAGPEDVLFVATGRALVRVSADGTRDERLCPEFECNAVGSNGSRVATVTSEGLFVFDHEWTQW